MTIPFTACRSMHACLKAKLFFTRTFTSYLNRQIYLEILWFHILTAIRSLAGLCTWMLKLESKVFFLFVFFKSFMVFNATFNNISVISWQVTDKLYHIMLYTSPWSRFELTTSVVIDTECIGSKSNYHTITAMMAP
jgi:hypothetical protein